MWGTKRQGVREGLPILGSTQSGKLRQARAPPGRTSGPHYLWVEAPRLVRSSGLLTVGATG